MRRSVPLIFILSLAFVTVSALWASAQDATDDTQAMGAALPVMEDVRYEVGLGDTLDDIAATFDVDLTCLRDSNDIPANNDLILVGDQLVIRVACPPYAGVNYVPFPRPLPGQGGGVPTYTVRVGDTLSDIALAFNISEVSLQEFNGLENANRITVGQVLEIPPDAPVYGRVPPLGNSALEQGGAEGDVIYTIQPGDTLDVIGAFYNASPTCIAQTNNIPNAGRIQPRQTIIISQGCAPYVGPNTVGGRVLPLEDEPVDAQPTQTPVPPTVAPTRTLTPMSTPMTLTATPMATPTVITLTPIPTTSAPIATPTQEVLEQGGGNPEADIPQGNILETLDDLDAAS